MSDDPNSGQATEREAYTPLSDRELHFALNRSPIYTTMRRTLLELVDQRRDRATLQKENAALQAEIRSLTNQELSPEYKEALDQYLRKPTDAEALAARLASAEDRLAATGPAPAEELVLERGSIVRIREGAHSGLIDLDHKRAWEVVGFNSPDGLPATVQLGLLPWTSGAVARPLYWVQLDDVVGLAE